LEDTAMMQRLSGALARAFLVILLIATPALMLPGVSNDSTQIVAFVAIFGAALVIFEYASVYPGLVEFRDAPPFNRIRFAALFIMVLLMATLVRDQTVPSVPSDLVSAFAGVVGSWLDFPYSPVRLVVLMLPESAPWSHVQLVRNAAAASSWRSSATKDRASHRPARTRCAAGASAAPSTDSSTGTAASNASIRCSASPRCAWAR
jgi:hypothetical protein